MKNNLSILISRSLLAVVLSYGLLFAHSNTAYAENPPLTLQELLEAVEDGQLKDQAEDSERLQRFIEDRSQRQDLLAEITRRRENLESVSADKEASFENNEAQIGDLEERLQERMGSLKELFGVLQQVAGDAQAQFFGSLTQPEFPERTDFLVDFAGRMGQANRLPEIAEIERLWFELQREMTRSQQIVTRLTQVVTAEGQEVEQPVTRVGLFNVISEGSFLKLIPETGRLVEFARQPSSRYLHGAQAIAAAEPGIVPLAIDPVRGQLLEVLTQAPNLLERISQGGEIGFAIIVLGVSGVLFALLRWAYLLHQGNRINRQLQRLDQPSDDNALGRILLASESKDILDIDTLELRIGEAVMQETPHINAYVPLLKIIAAIAPLMGLLGTVTGMIVTFQAITLFGAGDPRLMAGGISQALVTTVLGLCVAVPMLLLHNVVQMRARALTETLQHKAVAVVAQRAETESMQAQLESQEGLAA
jgi:biopolymer transport protein ExbB